VAQGKIQNRYEQFSSAERYMKENPHNKNQQTVSQDLDSTPNASALLKLLTYGAPGHRFPLMAHDRQLQLWVSGLGFKKT
jgi:hypothetical protein